MKGFVKTVKRVVVASGLIGFGVSGVCIGILMLYITKGVIFGVDE